MKVIEQSKICTRGDVSKGSKVPLWRSTWWACEKPLDRMNTVPTMLQSMRNIETLWNTSRTIWTTYMSSFNKQGIQVQRQDNSPIYTDDYLVVATTITSARLLSSQCKHGEIVRLLSSRARLSSLRYSRQNVSSDGHLRYLRNLSDQCKFGRLL